MRNLSVTTLSRAALCAAFALSGARVGLADVLVWQGPISEDQVKNWSGAPGDGSTDSTATGSLDVRYDESNGYLYFDISWDGLLSDLTKLHVHGPAASGASTPNHVFDIFNEPDILAAGLDPISDSVQADLPFVEQLVVGAPSFTEEVAFQHMVDGLSYVNVHSVNFPMGEIRGNLGLPTSVPPMTKEQQKCWGQLAKGYASSLKAQAKQVGYCLKGGSAGDLSAWTGGISEDQVKNWGGAPGDGSTDSTATGDFAIVYNAKTDDLSYRIRWDGLLSDLTKLHVHGPAASGASTPNHVFDIFNEPDILAAGVDPISDEIHVTTTFDDQLTVGEPSFTKEVALQHMMNELSYVNVHSVGFPMGEIRGNLILSDAVDACLREDFTGKIAGAIEKLDATIAATCAGPAYPTFGAAPTEFSSVAAQAAQDATVGMLEALYGSSIDSALADQADKATAKCQAITTKKVGKCASTVAKTYTICTKLALKGKKTVTAVDEVALENCVSSDPKGKIAKACSTADGSLGKIISKKCTGDLATIFPGPATSDLTTMLTSLSTAFTCETCKATNAVHAIAADCDVLDNGVADSSCE